MQWEIARLGVVAPCKEFRTCTPRPPKPRNAIKPVQVGRLRVWGLLGGSWVVISGVIRKVTTVITHLRGLITPLLTTHEPPSRVSDSRHQLNPRPMQDLPTPLRRCVHQSRTPQAQTPNPKALMYHKKGA